MEIKWLKGHCIPSTFTENIPDQSWGSNRWTPCSIKGAQNELKMVPAVAKQEIAHARRISAQSEQLCESFTLNAIGF